MAGDALNDPNYAARLKLSEDPAKAKERAGMVGDQYDVSGFSDKEISMALKGGSFGDEDYARLTGKSMTDDAKPDAGAETPAPETGNPEPKPGDNPGGDVLLPPNAGQNPIKALFLLCMAMAQVVRTLIKQRSKQWQYWR